MQWPPECVTQLDWARSAIIHLASPFRLKRHGTTIVRSLRLSPREFQIAQPIVDLDRRIDVGLFAMHSSDALQGSSFAITVGGKPASHADFFRRFTIGDRLALYTPGSVDGAGAVNLIMAYVTAFYDGYRATGQEFFAYPDFYAMYCGDKSPSYMMYDIYPDHKIVRVGSKALEVLRAVTDRDANVLLVPDGDTRMPWTSNPDNLDRLAVASARRSITICYAYAFDGQVRDGDVVITCNAKPLVDWVKTLFDSVADDDGMAARGRTWLEKHAGRSTLVQSYRRIELDEALGLL